MFNIRVFLKATLLNLLGVKVDMLFTCGKHMSALFHPLHFFSK